VSLLGVKLRQFPALGNVAIDHQRNFIRFQGKRATAQSRNSAETQSRE